MERASSLGNRKRSEQLLTLPALGVASLDAGSMNHRARTGSATNAGSARGAVYPLHRGRPSRATPNSGHYTPA